MASAQGAHSSRSGAGGSGGDGGKVGGKAGTSTRAVDNMILRALEAEYPRYIDDNELCSKFESELPKLARSQAYNRLLTKGRVEIAPGKTETGGNTVLYRFVDSKMAKKLAGLDAHERHIYELVKKSQAQGVNKKDLKFKTNIQAVGELDMYINKLKDRNLIKEINSVQGTRRKIYILAELEASKAHTGGPWYDDSGTYDQEFINAMYSVVLRWVTKQKQAVTVEQIGRFVEKANISKEKLKVEDLRSLLDTMLYDNELEIVGAHSAGGATKFRKARTSMGVDNLSTVPCGSCPVSKECIPGGVISPTSCLYMNNWLKTVVDW